MTEEVDPDGSTTLYAYNAGFHEVTLEIDEPADGRLSTTTNFYDATTGDLTTMVTDPGTAAAATTTFQWNDGRHDQDRRSGRQLHQQQL